MRPNALILLTILAATPLAAEDITIGTAFPYAPYVTRDANGAPIGAEPDILAAICTRAGWTCTWVELPFDDLIPALQAGRIDIAANGLGHTPERAALVHMACPYHPHMDSPPEGTFYVTDPNHNPFNGPIGVTGGSIYETALAREGHLTVPFEHEGLALQALHDGLVPAHFGSDYYAEQTGAAVGLTEAGTMPTGSIGFAFAITPTNPDLIEAFEQTQADLSRSGSLAAFSDEYFGESHPDAISLCDRVIPLS